MTLIRRGIGQVLTGRKKELGMEEGNLLLIILNGPCMVYSHTSIPARPYATVYEFPLLGYFYVLCKLKLYHIINIVKEKYQNKFVIQTSSNNLLRKGVNVILFHVNPGEATS